MLTEREKLIVGLISLIQNTLDIFQYFNVHLSRSQLKHVYEDFSTTNLVVDSLIRRGYIREENNRLILVKKVEFKEIDSGCEEV